MAKRSLDEILAKEMRGESIPEEELTPEAVELLVAYRKEPREVIELFRRGKTLKEYLGLPTEQREKIRNTLLKRKGVSRPMDVPLVIRINHENKAYEAATTYIKWINSGEAENLLKPKPGRSGRLEGRIELQDYLRDWNSEKKQPLPRWKEGEREWRSLYILDEGNGEFPNFYKLLDDKTAEELEKAEEQADIILAKYWKQEAKTAATTYINWINSGRAENWLKDEQPKLRNNLEGTGLKNFLWNWNYDGKKPLAPNKRGRQEWQAVFWYECQGEVPKFYKLLDEETKGDLKKAEGKAHRLFRAYCINGSEAV